MTDHVLAALRAKRTEVANLVHDTEKKLAKLRAALANLDAAANILTPEHPDHIAPRRRKTRYFAKNELPRLVLNILREAQGSLTAGEIAAMAIKAHDLPAAAQYAVQKHVLTILNTIKARGTIGRSGNNRNAQWAVAPSVGGMLL